MRNPRSDTLRKAADQKSIVKKCNVTGSRTVTCSNCGYINGIVKKKIKLLGIIHDRSKVNTSYPEDHRLAVSLTKEYNRSTGSIPEEMDPKFIYYLLKNMRDEVSCFILKTDQRN